MAKSWGQQFKSALFGMLMGVLIPTLALGQATLLPNAKQQYVDDAGNPVALGRVDYYVPNTSTRKTVWQDAAETTPQPNGVTLDAAGRPQPNGQTFGSGTYRQVVKDQNGLVVWDAVTTSTGGSGGGGGGSTVGDGNFVGTILAWNGVSAPTNYVFANGQEISRTVYSQYFATSTVVLNVICTSGTNVLSGISDTQNVRVGAPVEATCIPPNSTVISVSSSSVTVSLPASISTAVVATFFPNGHGNGSTTFNVPDLRNLVIAGRGNMGGTVPRGLLTSQFFGNQGPNAMGSTGGQQSIQIATSNLPPYTPAGTITNGVITVTNADPGLQSVRVASGTVGSGSAGLLGNQTYSVSQLPSTFLGTPMGGTQDPTTNLPPTFITNYIIKVLPDVSTVIASGVTSIAGMTGALTCGSGMVCGSQTISAIPPVAVPINIALYASQYGVRCNNVDDDYPGTQLALDAAVAIGAVKVIMPSGTCPMISGTPNINTWVTPGILAKPGVNLDGQGRDVTIIDNRQANKPALSINQAWQTAFQALNSMVASTGSGSLSTNTYYVQITMNDPLGNEIFVTLPKSIAVTGPTGRITLTLPATSPGYTFNIYTSTAPSPNNYGSISGSDAVALGGNQSIPITAIGTPHAVPGSKLASFQQAQFTNMTVTSTTGAAGASGIALFKSAYSTINNVLMTNLNGSGLTMPNYIGDLDGSLVTTVTKSKFDHISGWCLDLAGLTLEQSNFTLESSVLNICGTATANVGVSRTITAITNSTTPVVTTSVANTFVENDQIDIPNATGMALPADFYRVGTVIDSTHFQLKDLNGVFVDTTSLGAFASGTVSLSWRPPTVTTGNGGARYMGLISNWANNGYTQNYTTNIYFTEAGSSDGITIIANDFENTVGKAVYAAGVVTMFVSASECLSQVAFGTTVSCFQWGTGFAAGVARNVDLFPIKIRSDAAPANGFEIFQNTGNGTTFADTVRIHNAMSWQQYDITSRQRRFVGGNGGFVFDPIPGQIRFLVSATNVFKLVPLGYGATLPLHLTTTGEWVPYRIPDAGVTQAVTTSSPSTSYNIYVANTGALGAPYVITFSANVTGTAFNQGYSTMSSDSSKVFVGTWTTDGSGNFQPGGSGSSWYPPGGGGGGAPTGPAGGDLTGTYPNPTLAALGAATGPLGSATVAPIVTIDTKGRVTALTSATVTPAVGSITGLGASVATALAVNVNSVGSVVLNGGNLGTPATATLTNATGCPIGTCVSGLGASVSTALAININSVGSVVLNGGNLGSPATVGTMPAFTLGGTVTGGGNQISGAILVGGTAVGSALELRATSGVGVGAERINFTNGSNGATLAGIIAPPAAFTGLTATLAAMRIGGLTFGTWPSSTTFQSIGLASLDQTIGTNYNLLFSSAGSVYMNAQTGQSLHYRVNDVEVVTIVAAGTASTSSTTGAYVLNGGIGASGAIYGGAEITTGVVAVGSLPTCNAGRKGSRHFVNDANAAFTAGIGAVVAAGGANNVPVTCDGTNWRIG